MHRFVLSLARIMALLGGFVLALLIILTCVSVLGRGINTFAHWDLLKTHFSGLSQILISSGVGPVPGDFEIVEAGVAFSIFAFLPLCQVRSGHATVDIFTAALPAKTNSFLKTFWEICLTIVIILITWRLSIGVIDKFNAGETTFLLEFPKWWAYSISLTAAFVASIVALYCVYARLIEIFTGKILMTSEEGAVH